MSQAAIREQIKSILSSVDGVGVVHDRMRWASDWNKFLSLFKHADSEGIERINGWMFSRARMGQRQATMGEKEKAHIFKIVGIYGLSDESGSELVFQAIVDNIVDGFADNETLNDTCLTINPDWGPMDGALGVQVDLTENRMFGTVLCHYAELGLCAVETVEI